MSISFRMGAKPLFSSISTSTYDYVGQLLFDFFYEVNVARRHYRHRYRVY